MNTESIAQAVRDLLASAKNRNTDQGVVVYTNILKMLEEAETPGQVNEIREELNRALTGIEAHGDLTDSEFAIVRRLRGEEA